MTITQKILMLSVLAAGGCAQLATAPPGPHVYVEVGSNRQFTIHRNGDVSGYGTARLRQELCSEAASGLCLLHTFLNATDLSSRFTRQGSAAQVIWDSPQTFDVFASARPQDSEFVAWYSSDSGLLAFSMVDDSNTRRVFMSTGNAGYIRPAPTGAE